MNCPNCNQPITGGRKFCANCGYPAGTPDFFDANVLGIGFLDVLTKKYACFQGRARRKEFWTFLIRAHLIIPLILWIPLILVPVPVFMMLVYFVYTCGIVIPEAALTVRRFQDTGNKRWLALLLFGTVWGLGVFQVVRTVPVVFFILQFIFIIPIFIIASFDSQPGPNKYGPNPKRM